MDHRVATIRRWLLLIAAALLCLWSDPGLWFCLFAAPIIWTRTSGGTTGILIHPDGSGGWKIAVGDSGDADCACCGFGNCDQCTSQHDGSIQVVVASVADGTGGLNGNCGNCAALNGTYELPKIGACRWQVEVGITLSGASCECSGLEVLNLDLFLNGGVADGNFQCASGSAKRWTRGLGLGGFSAACASWSNTQLTDSVGSAEGCDNSMGTFHVTTL